MANTTFKGTVRAESGLKVSAQTAATGAYTDKFTIDSSGNVVVKGTLTRLTPATILIIITLHVQHLLLQILVTQLMV